MPHNFLKALKVSPLLFVLACSVPYGSHESGSTFSTAALEDSNISAIVESSVQEQAMEALVTMPTQFVVPYRDDRHAWERARVFFDKYATESSHPGQPVVTKVKKETWILTNRDTNPGRYVYEVKRIDDRKGYSYSVSCEPKQDANREDALMNARNLSRFIRDGSLEVSLLKR